MDVLLSAEDLFNLYTRGACGLTSFLREYFDVVVVICFVRHPLAYARSMAAHMISLGATFDDMRRLPKLPDYAGKISAFLDIVGSDAIHLLRYDESLRDVPAAVFNMLLTAMGRDASCLRIDVPIAARSLSHEAAMVFSALNAKRPVFIGNRRNLGRRIVPRAWLESFGHTQFTMPASWEAHVVDRGQIDLDWLHLRFGVNFGGHLPLSMARPSMPLNHLTEENADALADILHANALLIEEGFKEIYQLRSRLSYIQGDRQAAIGHLRDSLSLDPYQSAVSLEIESLSRLGNPLQIG